MMSYHRGGEDFGQLANQISAGVQRLSQNVSNVERLVRQLGTPQDSEQIRQRLHELVNSSNSLAKDTSELLKRLASARTGEFDADDRAQRLQRERLMSQFSDILSRLQESQRDAAKKEKMSFLRARAQSQTTSDWNPFEDDLRRDADLRSQTTSGGSSGGDATRLQIEQDVDIQALRDREEAIRGLESDISDVNQIFKDLAVLVHEQGEVIDSIEANVESAQVQVEHATGQLADARRYKAKSRRKLCCIILIGAVILFTIGLVVILSNNN